MKKKQLTGFELLCRGQGLKNPKMVTVKDKEGSYSFPESYLPVLRVAFPKAKIQKVRKGSRSKKKK